MFSPTIVVSTCQDSVEVRCGRDCGGMLGPDHVLKLRLPGAAGLLGNGGGRRNSPDSGASAVVRGVRLVVLKKRSQLVAKKRWTAPRAVLCADGE